MRRCDDLDSSRCFFRSDERVIHLNGTWYFASREGEQGPFTSRDEASVEMQRFVVEVQQLSAFQASRDAAKIKITDLELVPMADDEVALPAAVSVTAAATYERPTRRVAKLELA